MNDDGHYFVPELRPRFHYVNQILTERFEGKPLSPPPVFMFEPAPTEPTDLTASTDANGAVVEEAAASSGQVVGGGEKEEKKKVAGEKQEGEGENAGKAKAKAEAKAKVEARVEAVVGLEVEGEGLLDILKPRRKRKQQNEQRNEQRKTKRNKQPVAKPGRGGAAVGHVSSSSSPSSSSSSSSSSKPVLENVFYLLYCILGLDGPLPPSPDAAVAVLRAHAPSVSHDQRAAAVRALSR